MPRLACTRRRSQLATGCRRCRSRRADRLRRAPASWATRRSSTGCSATLDTEKAGYALLADEDLSFDYPHHAAHGQHERGVRLTAPSAVGRALRRSARQQPVPPDLAVRVRRRRSSGARAHRAERAAGPPGLARLAIRDRQRRHGRSSARSSSASAACSTFVSVTARGSPAIDELPTANSLPFMPASSVRPGMVMVDENGDFDVVTGVEWVKIDEPVYDLDVDRTHNFVANGIVTHNSIYKFRGADFRNLLKFEEAFPEAVTVVLDQNYRSSQRILDAANAVIAQQRVAPAEAPLDRQGRGRADRPLPGRRRARRGRVRRARDPPARRPGRSSLRRRRGLLPHQRAEPRARGVAGALRRAVPRVRRREVLRPARDQGRARVPARAREPRRRSVVEAHREHAAARRRRHVGREGRLVRERRGHPVPGRDRERGRGGRDRQGARRAARPARADGRGARGRGRAVSPRRSKRC